MLQTETYLNVHCSEAKRLIYMYHN